MWTTDGDFFLPPSLNPQVRDVSIVRIGRLINNNEPSPVAQVLTFNNINPRSIIRQIRLYRYQNLHFNILVTPNPDHANSLFQRLVNADIQCRYVEDNNVTMITMHHSTDTAIDIVHGNDVISQFLTGLLSETQLVHDQLPLWRQFVNAVTEPSIQARHRGLAAPTALGRLNNTRDVVTELRVTILQAQRLGVPRDITAILTGMFNEQPLHAHRDDHNDHIEALFREIDDEYAHTVLATREQPAHIIEAANQFIQDHPQQFTQFLRLLLGTAAGHLLENENRPVPAIDPTNTLEDELNNMGVDLQQIPNEFLCPILQRIMNDPVKSRHQTANESFERAAIVAYIQSKGGAAENPLDRSPITEADLVPDAELKARIVAWVSQEKTKRADGPSSRNNNNNNIM